MKRLKKLFIILVSVCVMATGVIPYSVFAADETTSDDVNAEPTDEIVVDDEDMTADDTSDDAATDEEADGIVEETVGDNDGDVQDEQDGSGIKPLDATDEVTDETDADNGDETVLAAPVLKKATAEASGTQITWGSVSGAAKYTVLRKKSGGSWSEIKSTTSTSYTDKDSLTSGTTYYYTVCAVASDGTKGAYDDTGLKAVYLKTPTLKKATAQASGTKITWGSVSGAKGYAIFRKKSGGNWSLVTTTTKTSYTDKKALTGGSTYYYSVRAYAGSATTAKNNKYNAAYWGGYNTSGLKSVYLKTPKLKKATSVTKGTKVTWGKVKGASGYAVFRKKSGGSWSLVKTTTKTSYTDKKALKGGSKYYYSVRAYKGKASTAKNNKYNAAYWGGYKSPGLKSVYLKNPTMKSAKIKSSRYVKVKWSKVKGASGYAVYRKKAGGKWSLIGTTKKTSYTDKKKMKSHTKYYYKVRAYKGKASTAKKHKYNAAYWGGQSKKSVKFDCIKNSNGTLVWNTAMYNKAQKFSSNTKWLILINTKTNHVGIFKGSKGKWDMKYYFECTSGASSTPTVKGSYTVKNKGTSFSTDDYTCWYYTQFYGNYLIHSVLYAPGSSSTVIDGRLGINASHGCVRMTKKHAKWVYDHIPRGTKVFIY